MPEPTFSSRRSRVGGNGGRREGDGAVERHPHLNRGVGAVKKVLGLDGRGSGGSSGQSREGEEGRRVG